MSLLKYWHAVIYRVAIFYGWSGCTAWENTGRTPFRSLNMCVGLKVEIDDASKQRL